ncbi:MAG: MltA domain-containing protein [Pseudomonadota bacterium]
MRLQSFGLLVLFVWLLSGCATSPSYPPTPSLPDTQELPAPPPERQPTEFEGLLAWQGASTEPGIRAFLRSCGSLEDRDAAEWLSARANWAGSVGEWRAVCESLLAAQDDPGLSRQVIEALMVPVEISSMDGASRFTGYFEPMIDARRIPQPGFTAPVPGPPSDLVQSDEGPLQSLPNGQSQPYPPRAEIKPELDRVLGYAHPADVFFLQIQGSGRLMFADGTTMRAAYYAHNGQPFRSTANWLLERGKIDRGEASMQGIRAWMDRVSMAEAQEAMNANPRFVFFHALPEGDPDLGPRGAANIPLTPLGSMAIDRDFHALGVPYLVETNAPGLGGLWRGILVSQDTGGAIKGPVRGDIYFGTGDAAGSRAGTMNAPGRMWALLPRTTAARMQLNEVASVADGEIVLRARLP